MAEMKLRLFTAHDAAQRCLSSGGAKWADFELACLQLRKAIELIGFSTMSAELDAYRSVSNSFERDWNFANILRALRRVSPNSFPFSVQRERSTAPGVDWHFVPQSEYAVDPSVLIEWHGRLNVHLHAANPYRATPDHQLMCLRIKSNVQDISSFLSDHCFLRSDRAGGFLVSLNVRDAPVTLHQFGISDHV